MVRFSVLMDVKKVATIVRSENTAFVSSEREHLPVRDRGIRSPRFKRSQNIVSQASEFNHNLLWNVLVWCRNEPLLRFVLPNLRFDFRRMSASISPRVHEILSAQSWIRSQ